MINVLFIADFPIAKTGIASTASAILAERDLGEACLYAKENLEINGSVVRVVENLDDLRIDLVFTHAEYSGLRDLLSLYPNALFHVGDWPINYWKSVLMSQVIRGFLGLLRCHWRLRYVSCSARLAFVTQEDFRCAYIYGFKRALHLPIGVRPPTCPISENVDFETICFTGNFRYEPNLKAVTRLLKLMRAEFPQLKVLLAGFYADDLEGLDGHEDGNVEIYPDLPSIVDFLATRRPIYVSLVETGAGAKNKILEALVSGCPIICTPESLDDSIPKAASIRVVEKNSELLAALKELCFKPQQDALRITSFHLADQIRTDRSWASVAEKLHYELVFDCRLNKKV